LESARATSEVGRILFKKSIYSIEKVYTFEKKYTSEIRQILDVRTQPKSEFFYIKMNFAISRPRKREKEKYRPMRKLAASAAACDFFKT
jgi:hypothetical protein